MPIQFDYQADAAPIGNAALEAGQAASQFERDKILEQVRQSEQDYEFNLLGLEQKSQLAALGAQFNYDQLGESGYQFDQQQAARAQEGSLDRQSQNQREQLNIAAAYAKDQKNKEFQILMADHKTISEFDGFKDQDQEAEMQGNWAKRATQVMGMPMEWNSPMQMAQQQEIDQRKEQVMSSIGAAFADENGVPMVPEAQWPLYAEYDEQGNVIGAKVADVQRTVTEVRNKAKDLQAVQEDTRDAAWEREKFRKEQELKRDTAKVTAEKTEEAEATNQNKRESEMAMKSDIAKHKYAQANRKHKKDMEEYKKKVANRNEIVEAEKDPQYAGNPSGPEIDEPLAPSIAAHGFPSINERIDPDDPTAGLSHTGEFALLKNGAIFRDLNNVYWIKQNGVPVRI